MLLKEAETDIVAREQELDHRLAVGTTRLVEADRAALHTIKMRSGVACPEKEGVGGYRLRCQIGRLDGGSRDNGGD
jgi:hypothetical protein